MDTKNLLKEAETRFLKEMNECDWFRESPRPFQPAIRYYKKLDTFKASNVEFDPKTMVATSYGWWELVKVIRGRVVFNKCRYSQSTSMHQSKVRHLLEQLGIAIDMEIDAPHGLQRPESAIDRCERKIKDLEKEINKPRSQARKNADRRHEIEALREEIAKIENLLGVKKELKAA